MKEAVIDRILQTTRDVQAALNLPKAMIPAEKLEASLVYTRFHGVSSRSSSLLNLLQMRCQRPIAPHTYMPLLQQCQAVFCHSRHLLLNHSVRKHVEQLRETHGLVGMTRLACVFLMRVCSVESALYLDFFGIPPTNKTKLKKKKISNGDGQKEKGTSTATHNDNESDDSEDEDEDENESKGRGGGKYRNMSASRKKKQNKPSPYLDDEPFQKMLSTTVCSNLHRVIRRGVVLLSDMDLLCQVVSVLREERSNANASVHTRSLARSISAMIEDAQERLIFCTQNVLTKEVVKFHPSPSDVDYPNRLLQQQRQTPSDTPSTTNANTNNENDTEGDSILQAQMHLYESWYPPMRTVLKVLSKIFRVVEPRVFEDIALQAVQACTSSLKDAANTVRVVSGVMDSDLFLVKHLLVSYVVEVVIALWLLT
jgi:cell pole-organizing protein PopZ